MAVKTTIAIVKVIYYDYVFLSLQKKKQLTNVCLKLKEMRLNLQFLQYYVNCIYWTRLGTAKCETIIKG